jgi:catechol 2,3-dioxygenase-like lactoylglutathione lyase family enzyme
LEEEIMPNYWYHHIHLTSPDALKTGEFYERLFHAQRVMARKMPSGAMMVSLSLNGSNILVSQPATPPPPLAPGPATSGLEHFGIRTDDIEATVAELKAAGVKFRDDIREAMPGTKIAFFWAPENVLIELVETKG